MTNKIWRAYIEAWIPARQNSDRKRWRGGIKRRRRRAARAAQTRWSSTAPAGRPDSPPPRRAAANTAAPMHARHAASRHTHVPRRRRRRSSAVCAAPRQLTAHAQLIAHAHARMMCAHAPDADVIVAGILKIRVPPLALYSCVFVYNSFSSLVRVGDGALIIQDHVCCPFSKWHFFKILFFLVYNTFFHFWASNKSSATYKLCVLSF